MKDDNTLDKNMALRILIFNTLLWSSDKIFNIDFKITLTLSIIYVIYLGIKEYRKNKNK